MIFFKNETINLTMFRSLFLSLFISAVLAGEVHLYGDSITGNMALCQDFTLFDSSDIMINHAKSSATIDDVQQQLSNSIFTDPKIIVITVGFKDIIRDLTTPLSFHISKYRAFLNRLKELYPNIVIMIHSILPASGSSFGTPYELEFLNTLNIFNQMLKTEVSKLPNNFLYVDIYKLFIKNDGLLNRNLFMFENELWVHPTCEGYYVWKRETNRIYSNYLEEINKETPEETPKEIPKEIQISASESISSTASVSTTASASTSASTTSSASASITGIISSSISSSVTPSSPSSIEETINSKRDIDSFVDVNAGNSIFRDLYVFLIMFEIFVMFFNV